MTYAAPDSTPQDCGTRWSKSPDASPMETSDFVGDNVTFSSEQAGQQRRLSRHVEPVSWPLILACSGLVGLGQTLLPGNRDDGGETFHCGGSPPDNDHAAAWSL